MTMLKTYCIECDQEVDALVMKIDDELIIKGEPVSYRASVAKCPNCDTLIGDVSLEDANLDAAYEKYCISHNLMTKDEIQNLRESLNLSLREFSRFLGFGEQTVAKYEKGAIPDLLHSNTMRLAATPAGARMLLNMNGATLQGSSATRVANYIERGALSESSYNLIMLSDAEDKSPSINNGYRTYDSNRAAMLLACLAEKCGDFFKTKAQKAMFFCDNLCFETLGKSLTGMTYVHADRGPIMPDYAIKLQEMEQQGFISQCELGWGTIIVPGQHASNSFTKEEMELIDKTAEFVNSFGSANELSEYSHDLDAWKNTASGAVISYGANYGEITDAINRKIGLTQ